MTRKDDEQFVGAMALLILGLIILLIGIGIIVQVLIMLVGALSFTFIVCFLYYWVAPDLGKAILEVWKR